MKYVLCMFVILVVFPVNNVCFALDNIVDYFLNNPNAWEETKRIIRKEPVKVIVVNGLRGLGFNLTELTV